MLCQVQILFSMRGLVRLGVYELLSHYAPVEGVAGNTDPSEIGEKLGFSRIVETEGLRLGLVHGHRGANGTEQNAIQTFAGEKLMR